MPSPTPYLATAPVLAVRARILARLGAIAERVGAVEEQPLPERRDAMRRIVADLSACLDPHLRWEERTIHPLVDKFACEGPAAFSASMRYEHEIIDRWLADLATLAEGDAVRFTRRADNLLGIVAAHFELEEHVLFPILDRASAATTRLAEPPDPRA